MSVYAGEERRLDPPPIQSEQFIVVKSWHTLIIVLTVVVGIVLSYGAVRDQTDENTRRIRDLEQRPAVTQQSVDDLNRRLGRLEDKIDAQDLREYKRSGEPTKR